MKSRFFRETGELDRPLQAMDPDKLNICLRMDKQAYENLLAQAQRLGLSSGEYLERVLCREDPGKWRLH